MSRHIMIDLETLGTGSNAPIIQIGACNLYGSDTFRRNILVEDWHNPEGGAVLWWMRQSEEARRSAFNQDGAVRLSEALTDLLTWMGDVDTVWAGPTSFDLVILSNACRSVVGGPEWPFRTSQRCFSTLKRMFPDVEPPEFEGIEHDALCDAQHQVAWLRKISLEKGLEIE